MNKTKNDIKYKMTVIRGAFINPLILNSLKAKTIEELENSNWIGLDEVIINIKTIKELQKEMVKHYDDTSIPWYMDGYKIDKPDEIIVAFGADDGEGGRIFTFNKNDSYKYQEVIKYGISKGIPEEQMNFLK